MSFMLEIIEICIPSSYSFSLPFLYLFSLFPIPFFQVRRPDGEINVPFVHMSRMLNTYKATYYEVSFYLKFGIRYILYPGKPTCLASSSKCRKCENIRQSHADSPRHEQHREWSNQLPPRHRQRRHHNILHMHTAATEDNYQVGRKTQVNSSTPSV